jgi:hypothetical protein
MRGFFSRRVRKRGSILRNPRFFGMLCGNLIESHKLHPHNEFSVGLLYFFCKPKDIAPKNYFFG